MTTSGKTIVIDYEADEKFESIKITIEKKTGMPKSLQRILYGSKLLNNHKLCSDYGIQNESNLRLTFQFNKTLACPNYDHCIIM